MTRRRHLAGVFACSLALAAAALGPLTGCKKDQAGIAAEQTVLPTVRDDAKGLSFTYVDEKGNPHVVDTIAEVPPAQAQKVRVMDPAHAPPEDMMYLADLTRKNEDGTYAVAQSPRSEFESYIVERRKAVGPTLASNGANAQGGAVQGDGGISLGALAATGQPRVIIYGAEWCGACHEAAKWLSGKHVKFVEKDIEKDSGAEREMRAKLAKAGLSGGSIPVIDVGGKIMVGFSAPKIQAALGDTI